MLDENSSRSDSRALDMNLLDWERIRLGRNRASDLGVADSGVVRDWGDFRA